MYVNFRLDEIFHHNIALTVFWSYFTATMWRFVLTSTPKIDVTGNVLYSNNKRNIKVSRFRRCFAERVEIGVHKLFLALKITCKRALFFQSTQGAVKLTLVRLFDISCDTSLRHQHLLMHAYVYNGVWFMFLNMHYRENEISLKLRIACFIGGVHTWTFCG